MAIAKTGAMFKTLSFDNQSSRNYGVYITGEAVYNAPNRDVEMVTIPGRNGAFAKDNGRFENIEVTYPAGIAADNEQDFADAISDFRNMLCSRKGYCRLTDDYNPNEFRMAVYKSGLEVSPALLRAGEFDITFECKPQRFLTSGETKTAIPSGGTITNPTLFPSKPKLEFYGYGDVNINSDTITVDNTTLGTIKVLDASQGGSSNSTRKYIDVSNIFNGDPLYSTTPAYGEIQYRAYSGYQFNSFVIDSTDGVASVQSYAGIYKTITLAPTAFNFVYGTASSIEASANFTAVVQWSPNPEHTYTGTVKIKITYDGADEFYYLVTETSTFPSFYFNNYRSVYVTEMFADSSKTATGNPMYIDLDIGEAWNEDNVNPVSSDNAVTLPAILPTLSPGSNTITYDNTITNFKIIPRWWKI